MRPAVADLPGGADTSAAGLSRIFTIVGESRASLARCSLASGSPGAIWRIQGFPSGVLNLSIPSSSSRSRDSAVVLKNRAECFDVEAERLPVVPEFLVKRRPFNIGGTVFEKQIFPVLHGGDSLAFTRQRILQDSVCNLRFHRSNLLNNPVEAVSFLNGLTSVKVLLQDFPDVSREFFDGDTLPALLAAADTSKTRAGRLNLVD